MRPIFTLLAVSTILFSSCSTSRKVSQTPDDLYYSPGTSSRAAAASSSGEGSEYYSTAPSDQYVRMKTVDDARWSTFDDYNDYDSYYAPTPMGGAYYGYSPYGLSPYGYGYGGYSGMSIGLGFWDPYFGWNSYFLWNTCYNPYFYNPYYGGSVVIVKNGAGVGSSPFYNRLTAFNPTTYHRNGVYVAGNTNRFYRPAVVTTSTSPYNSGAGARYSNSSNRSFYRTNGNTNNPRPSNGNGSFGQQPVRTFSPSSSGSSGSGGGFGGGGGGGSFSRPGGGGFRH